MLKKFYTKHPNAEPSLRSWNKITCSAQWKNLAEVRQDFSSADQVDGLTVFDIGGNKYRLITFILYKTGKIYIRDVLTHAEYDKERWKNDPWLE